MQGGYLQLLLFSSVERKFEVCDMGLWFFDPWLTLNCDVGFGESTANYIDRRRSYYTHGRATQQEITSLF